MKTLTKASQLLNVINRRLSELCGFLLFIIIILLMVNTVSREIGYPVEGLSNLSVLVLISVVYLGLSTTEQHKQHAAVELLDSKLSKKSKRRVDIFIHLVKLITVLIFFYASIGNFLFSVETGEGFADVVHIPLWPSKLALLIGLFFFALQILVNLLRAILDPRYADDENHDPSKDLTANI